MSITAIAAIYGWPITIITSLTLLAAAFFVIRRIIDAITGKKR